MLSKIKSDFYNLLLNLGYNVSDNGTYVENFPWLMIRVNDYELEQNANAERGRIVLTLDIFSQYAGEKEIIDIVENIANHLKDLYKNKNVIYCKQQSLKILDDKNTGPVRKHGVVSYNFQTARVEEVVLNDKILE